MSLFFLGIFAEFAGGYSDGLFKQALKMLGASVAYDFCDVLNGHFGVFEEEAGAVDLHIGQRLVKAFSGIF